MTWWAFDDARIELMAARHRLSKLAPRHGHVYDPGKHGAAPMMRGCVGSVATSCPPLGGRVVAFDAGYDAVTTIVARKRRLEAQIEAAAAESEFTATTRRLCCLRGGGIDRDWVRAGRRDRRLGTVHRWQHRRLPGLGPEYSSGGSLNIGADHQDRQQARPPLADRSSLAPQGQLPAREDDAGPVGAGPGRGRGPR